MSNISNVPPEQEDDFEAFKRVVHSRRSIREFLPEPVPDSIVEACLRLAFLAPSSQNLQTWQFFWVRDPIKQERLRTYCLDQPAARNAPTLLVAVARPDFWPLTRRLHLAYYESKGDPSNALPKYRRLVPLMLAEGPGHILGPLKNLALALLGQGKPIWRGPLGYWGQQLWATKTTALACENLLLALRAAGYDTCPMEGFDEPRVKHLLALPHEARIVMVIAAGRRTQDRISEQVRFDPELFLKRL